MTPEPPKQTTIVFTPKQAREGDRYRLKYTEGRFLKRFYLEGFAE